MPITLSTPLSLYSIPAMWLLAYYPTYLKSSTIVKVSGYNNVQPRTNVARLSEKKVQPALAARVARMEGAHINGVENFPVWAIAVLVGNFAGVDNKTLNIVSSLYLISRVVYNWIYINQTTQKQAGMRTLVWLIGVGFPLYLYVASANLLRRTGV